MHSQLALLLELQDLRNQLKELRTESGSEAVEEEHFNIDPAEAAEALETKIEELEDGLSPVVGRRYKRILGSLDRVVAPVIGGVCYGCFVSIPTARAGDQDPNDQLQHCESCGRFIYIVP